MEVFTLKYEDDYGFDYTKEFDTMEALKAFVEEVGLDFYQIVQRDDD